MDGLNGVNSRSVLLLIVVMVPECGGVIVTTLIRKMMDSFAPGWVSNLRSVRTFVKVRYHFTSCLVVVTMYDSMFHCKLNFFLHFMVGSIRVFLDLNLSTFWWTSFNGRRG